MIGQTLSHYEILEKLGEGGMGVVYRGVDLRLGRQVAIKVLPATELGDRERRERLAQEARAASALNHPNIVTIYDIDRAEAGSQTLDFVAMEYVDGEPLSSRIPEGGLPLAEALGYAVEIAGALAAAHRAGILHRDLKPANLMVNRDGHVKVLDFGLAKLIGAGVAGADEPTLLSPVVTRRGDVLGTPAYMSPEQAAGEAVDARSDVFSIGIVLFEMLAGRRPFDGSPSRALSLEPAPALRTARADAPGALERIVARCLAADPADRYPSAVELLGELAAYRQTLAQPGLRALFRRREARLGAAAAVVVLAALAAWLWNESSGRRWARQVALPEIGRLVEEGDLAAAYRLAREARRRIEDDPQLERLWNQFVLPTSILSEPPGAEVLFKGYLEVDEPWESLGSTPLEALELPDTLLRFRVEKAGFDPIEAAPLAAIDNRRVPRLEFSLIPAGTAPPGMVRVPAGAYGLGQAPPVEIDPFWIDRYEVTNRQFQEFVDAGGYRRPEHWREPFENSGETLAFEEAMSRFVDATGRPGPATWELGTYLEGTAELPVGGVSWYEAAAYAAWAGKSLPTLHHWFLAAAPDVFSEILPLSNFGGDGPAVVGSHPGLGPNGTYDMAGNVKEWSASRSGDQRYLLGGAWSDPTYLFDEPEGASPFAREETYGFRCVLYTGPLGDELTAPVEVVARDYRRETPVSDEVFAALESAYAYDRTPLNAVVESIDDSPPHWRVETISFDAAYGEERVTAHLFLPRNALPPYQTVIYFPTSLAETVHSSDHLELRWFGFVIRGGRAVLHPVYKGTYERNLGGPRPTGSKRRDLVVQWSKDIGRSIDYLETRADLDPDRLAYYGFSLGAVYGPILTAVEDRFQTAIFQGGGFTGRRLPPEAEPLNFAPRVRIPVLMVGGEHDFVRPVESAQRPQFDLFGTPAEYKRLALLEGGHIPPRIQGLIKEVLDWLDRYLDPVPKP